MNKSLKDLVNQKDLQITWGPKGILVVTDKDGLSLPLIGFAEMLRPENGYQEVTITELDYAGRKPVALVCYGSEEVWKVLSDIHQTNPSLS